MEALPSPSAATSIICFLLAVIAGLLLTTASAVLAWQWWKARQKRARLQEALQQAQIYALMGGERLPTGLARRRLPYSQGGGNVIVLGGGAQQTVPNLTLDDLGAADSLASLLPPDGGGWEVLQ